MIKAVALGLALVVTVLLTGCGIIVTDEAPTGDIRASAPALLSTFPEVEELAPASTRTISLGKARRLVRQTALEIRIPACDDDPLGRGFALDAHTLVADRDAVPGSGWVRVETANRRSTAVGAATAYRLGDLGVIQVARRLPRSLGSDPNVGRRGVSGRRHRARRQAPAPSGRDRRQRFRSAVRREDEGASAELGGAGRGRRPGARRQGTDRRRRVRGRRGDEPRPRRSRPARFAGARPGARSRRSTPATDPLTPSTVLPSGSPHGAPRVRPGLPFGRCPRRSRRRGGQR